MYVNYSFVFDTATKNESVSASGLLSRLRHQLLTLARVANLCNVCQYKIHQSTQLQQIQVAHTGAIFRLNNFRTIDSTGAEYFHVSATGKVCFRWTETHKIPFCKSLVHITIAITYIEFRPRQLPNPGIEATKNHHVTTFHELDTKYLNWLQSTSIPVGFFSDVHATDGRFLWCTSRRHHNVIPSSRCAPRPVNLTTS